MRKVDRIGGDRGEVGSARGLDRRLPPRSQGDALSDEQTDDLRQALAELRAAARRTRSGVDLALDPNRGEVVVFVVDGETRRILRRMSPEEALRLVRLLRAGRQQILDRVV